MSEGRSGAVGLRHANELQQRFFCEPHFAQGARKMRELPDASSTLCACQRDARVSVWQVGLILRGVRMASELVGASQAVGFPVQWRKSGQAGPNARPACQWLGGSVENRCGGRDGAPMRPIPGYARVRRESHHVARSHFAALLCLVDLLRGRLLDSRLDLLGRYSARLRSAICGGDQRA